MSKNQMLPHKKLFPLVIILFFGQNQFPQETFLATLFCVVFVTLSQTILVGNKAPNE
jgi:hypothetical protein